MAEKKKEVCLENDNQQELEPGGQHHLIEGLFLVFLLLLLLLLYQVIFTAEHHKHKGNKLLSDMVWLGRGFHFAESMKKIR